MHVHVGLELKEHGEIGFEIYSETRADDPSSLERMEARIVHCQGNALLNAAGSDAALDFTQLDMAQIQARCTLGQLNAAQCYALYRNMGIEYGEAFQGLQQVYSGRGEVLAKLRMPPKVQHTQAQYVLHPSVLDSALQGCIAMAREESAVQGGA